MKKLLLAITPGDSNGIGPEVTEKSLVQLKSKLTNIELHLFSKKTLFSGAIHKMPNVVFHEPTSSSPTFSGWAVTQAAKWVSKHKNSALVTGPISKLSLHQEGYPFSGHTDLLGNLFKVKEPTMILENRSFRVALATDHLPLKEVSQTIQMKLLTTKMQTLLLYLNSLGIKKPRVAVLGLNPHAGENGVLGKEELKTILPAIQKMNLKYKNSKFIGPYSADSFFATELKKSLELRHHAVLAMYHDQGLIPLKICGFNQGINVTLGLPIIRTSVDHGTAPDLFEKNKADPTSMKNAIISAIQMIKGK